MSEIEANSKDPLDELDSFTGRELQEMDLAPPSYIVKDILPEGMSLLVAKPKSGKTLMAQNISVAIASGNPAFGKIPIKQGRVLFLALEGSKNGMQKRLDDMLQGEEAPTELHFVRDFPSLGGDALTKLRTVVEHYPDLRLIVIDTFQAIRGKRRKQSAYADDYEALKPLTEFSEKTGVSVLAIHHTNKRQAEFDDVDPLDLVSGTTGIAGAVDNVLVLQQKQLREKDATLEVIGREVERHSHSFSLDGDRAMWRPQGEEWKFAKTEPRQKILDVVLEANEPLGPKEIAELTGKKGGNVRALVGKMLDDGELRKTDYGKYGPPPTPP